MWQIMNFYRFYNILNEYGETLTQTLIEKFKKEQPGLSRQTIEIYIKDFEKIKNKIKNKDITTFSWKELENTVDSNRPEKKIKAGTIDPTVTDANLIYNQNKIRMYIGKDKKSCIRYSNGYSFCIGARGNRNLYARYRIDNKGTPYFVFNDNLPKTDNRHLIVIFRYELKHSSELSNDEYYQHTPFSVTDASNQGEKEYQNIQDIIKDYAWVKELKSLIKHQEPDLKEKIEHFLQQERDLKMIDYSNSINAHKKEFKTDPYLHQEFRNMIKRNADSVNDILTNNKKVANINLYLIRGPDRTTDTDPFPFFTSSSEFVTNETELVMISQSVLPYNSINDVLKNIISNISYDELSIDEKEIEKIKQKVLENKDEIKNKLENNKDFAVVGSVILGSTFILSAKSLESLSNVIILPYIIISLGDITEIIQNEIKNNQEEITKIIDLEKTYKKQLNWINSASLEELSKIDLPGYLRSNNSRVFAQDSTQ